MTYNVLSTSAVQKSDPVIYVYTIFLILSSIMFQSQVIGYSSWCWTRERHTDWLTPSSSSSFLATLWHMEFLGPGSELQLWPKPQLWQHQILNPLCYVGDWTCVSQLPGHHQSCYAIVGTPPFPLLIRALFPTCMTLSKPNYLSTASKGCHTESWGFNLWLLGIHTIQSMALLMCLHSVRQDHSRGREMQSGGLLN